MAKPAILYTPGSIARELGVPVHRVEYVIRSRGIEAAGIAGHIRVYDAAALLAIKSELQAIAEAKGGVA